MSIEPHEWSFMDIDGYSCITCGFKYLYILYFLFFYKLLELLFLILNIVFLGFKSAIKASFFVPLHPQN